jgi:predicted transcriptional regulator
MASTVLSVRIPEQLKEQLDYLIRSTKRSKAYLAAEALGDYVKKNAWRAKELHEAISVSESTDGIHELQVRRLPYFLPYRVVDDRIEILRIFHESQERPSAWESNDDAP